MESLPYTWVDFVEMLIAVAAGFIIGFEREVRLKPAGVTTIIIVTLASTMVMQLADKLPSAAGAPIDPTRLAAGVITGIGFLGAGVILRTGAHIHGITTAATIWFMAAAGLAIGAGYYVPALAAIFLVWLGFAIDPLVDRMVSNRQIAKGLSPGTDRQVQLRDDPDSGRDDPERGGSADG
ncbi:MAG TPA: MgtC/SapB family protein [Firmicutes bacterium]|nr:MgtC/SapB family protein [Bacillota bacterium]